MWADGPFNDVIIIFGVWRGFDSVSLADGTHSDLQCPRGAIGHVIGVEEDGPAVEEAVPRLVVHCAHVDLELPDVLVLREQTTLVQHLESRLKFSIIYSFHFFVESPKLNMIYSFTFT